MSDLVGFDLTISVKKSTDDPLEVINRLNEIAAKWAFQKEEGRHDKEGNLLPDDVPGYIHWQVRLRLMKKKSLDACKNAYKEHMWGAHWTPTTSGVHTNQKFNYQMKLDTRIDGPWTDADPEAMKPPPLTRQLREFLKHPRYPWQDFLLDTIKEQEDRKIKVFLDRTGNSGKSIMLEYCEYIGLAYEVPPMVNMEDLMQCCMSIPAQKCYLIDMPRGMKKDKLAGFYSGLEALKNGIMYDKRYAFKKRRIDRPQEVVFTNTLPDFSLMSPDRWEIWEIMPDKSIQQYHWNVDDCRKCMNSNGAPNEGDSDESNPQKRKFTAMFGLP